MPHENNNIPNLSHFKKWEDTGDPGQEGEDEPGPQS